MSEQPEDKPPIRFEQPGADFEPVPLIHIPFRVGSRNAVVPIILPDEKSRWDYVTTGKLHPGIRRMADEEIARFRSQHPEPPA